MAGTSQTRPRFDKIAGAVSIAECQITFATADARVLIAEAVPEGAVLIDAWFDIETAFNSGTSDELNIGWGAVGGGDSDAILDAVDGQGTPGVFPTTRGIPAVRLAAEVDLYAYHVQVGGDATAGSARAYVMYARTADNG